MTSRSSTRALRPVMEPSAAALALKAVLASKPGSIGQTLPSAPRVTMFKVMGKMFAILATGRSEHVTLKCDPHLGEIMREQYTSIAKRTHLNARLWISIDLNGDMPTEEIERLAAHSYDLVCAVLTRRQRAELGEAGAA